MRDSPDDRSPDDGPPADRSSDDEPDAVGRDTAAFERVDWDEVGGWRKWVTAERVVLAVGLFALLDLYNYYGKTGSVYLLERWVVGPEDWLFMLAIVVTAAYVVTPLVARPRRAKRFLARLRDRPGTAVSVAVVGAVLATGTVVLVNLFRAKLTAITGDSLDRLQPPLFGSVPARPASDCVGPETDAPIYLRECFGSWKYPLGTDRMGYDMIDVLIQGAEPVAYVALITVGLVVPLATVVGLVAGYYGGLVDDVLMAYVDLQLSIPAIAVYLLAYMFVVNSPTTFLVAFGLLSWGGIARIVRSETLQRREEGYVLTARAAGASGPSILRRHVLPNVTNSVVPATFHLLAILVLTEAGLAFLGFYAFPRSWGETIEEGLQFAAPLEIWWVAAFPAVALAITVVACKLAGDGFRDVLDPRGDG